MLKPFNKLPTEGDQSPSLDSDAGPSRKTVRMPAPRPREKYGLFILHDRETAAADIVAIHGLCGDPFDTWTEETSKKLWLRDFLPSQVPNTRIMSYGYDSAVAFSKSETELGDVAADLLDRLNIERDTPEKSDRIIIFICHSLGGIVVKKALILAHQRSGSYGGLLLQTKGVIFMGTPHRGANTACWANFATQALQALGTTANRRILSDLQKNSETLRQISQQFVERGSTLQMKTFYETTKLDYMNCLVVEKDSAILNLPTELPAAPISADHRSMCKFAFKDEQKYRPVWKAVETLCASPITLQILRVLAILKKANSDQLLRHISVVDQENQRPRTHPSNCDQPKFYWIFKNMDFERWRSNSGSEVLWLSGPAGCRISDVSSRIVDLLKGKPSKEQHLILYFFCSTACAEASIVIPFVNTVLDQLICSLPQLKEEVTSIFLSTLLKATRWGKPGAKMDQSPFRADDSPETTIEKILQESRDEMNGYWRALRAVMDVVSGHELSLIIDGLDKIEHQRPEFVLGIHALIEHLRERSSTTRVLLTSRPQAEIKDILSELPCIEYDKERKECLASLRFDNTRYEKISEEHEGSLQWLWTKPEYLAWSSTGTSDILLIEGKPGSGKSTLMKYFKRSLMQRESRGRQIVASFYYSYREGEHQTKHSNMLRSVLYDILNQNEEFFFHFQRYHRERGEHTWPYDFLKKILLSLTKHHPLEKRIYLIIDAVDESVDGDRYDVIELLHGLCAITGPCIVKVFVASRPIVGLNRYSVGKDKVIRLEDVNSPDILKYAESFLLRLEFPPDIINEAKEYIVQNAQGVFAWVHLVKEELLRYAMSGTTEDRMFSFLKSLPTELEGFYERILTELEGGKREDINDGFRMLQFVLFAYRPLKLEELRQALAIPEKANIEFPCSSKSFQRSLIHGIDKRLISCTGNLLEVKDVYENNIVQVMHQSVREFFRPNGPTAQSIFRMNSSDAHTAISNICIRYLMLCITDISSIVQQAGSNPWKAENFETCVQYLSGRPFLNYVLGYMKRHLQECNQITRDSELVSQLRGKLNMGPVAYLLENWVPQDWGQRDTTHEEPGYGKHFSAELLHTATRMRYSQVVEALLIAGVEVEACLGGRTPLIISAEGGDQITARVLLDYGAVVETQEENKRTALHLAAANGHDLLAQLLIDRGSVIEAQEENKRTALHLAAANGHNLVARLLTDRGADKEAKDERKQTPLHLAAANGHYLVTGLLIDQGAAKEAKDEKGQTPLHLAAANGHDPIIRLLTEKGADKKAKDVRGWEALHMAAWNGHEATIQMLVQTLDSNKEEHDMHGWTALHVSAMNGRDSAIQRLIEHLGANKEAVDNEGWTALHFAAALGLVDTVRLLLETLNLNRNARDKTGRTALDLAQA